MEEKKSLRLEALLDPDKFKQEIKRIEGILEGARMLSITLSNKYMVWHQYIDMCVQGKEYSIAVSSEHPLPDSRVLIESKDGVLEATVFDTPTPFDRHPAGFSMITLDTRNLTVQATDGTVTADAYKEFMQRFEDAEYRTIPGQRADIK
ncbi:TPA: hypothetical protein HA265_06095 [Candidatus Woesearchaeota archaeon]|nr:hypothetical protein [Candidatus Woesearchaeota archaeon]